MTAAAPSSKEPSRALAGGQATKTVGVLLGAAGCEARRPDAGSNVPMPSPTVGQPSDVDLAEDGAQVEVVMTGGTLRGSIFALLGSEAERSLLGMRIRRAFLSGNGFSLERGLSTPKGLVAGFDRALVAAAEEVVVLVDYTKIGVEGHGADRAGQQDHPPGHQRPGLASTTGPPTRRRGGGARRLFEECGADAAARWRNDSRSRLSHVGLFVFGRKSPLLERDYQASLKQMHLVRSRSEGLLIYRAERGTASPIAAYPTSLGCRWSPESNCGCIRCGLAGSRSAASKSATASTVVVLRSQSLTACRVASSFAS